MVSCVFVQKNYRLNVNLFLWKDNTSSGCVRSDLIHTWDTESSTRVTVVFSEHRSIVAWRGLLLRERWGQSVLCCHSFLHVSTLIWLDLDCKITKITLYRPPSEMSFSIHLPLVKLNPWLKEEGSVKWVVLLVCFYTLVSSILDLFPTVGSGVAWSSEIKNYKRQSYGRKSWGFSYNSVLLAFCVGCSRFLSKCQGEGDFG